MDHAPPGATVHIAGGTYVERLRVHVSGAEGQFITFEPKGFSGPPGCGGYTGVSCGGDQVVLDYASLGTIRDQQPFLDIVGQHHVRIQGLTFQNYTVIGANQRGVRIQGASHQVEILYNTFQHNRNVGPWDGTQALLHFYVWSPATDITVSGNEFNDIVSNYSETLTMVAPHVTFANNYLHDTDGIAIDVGPGSDGGAVRANLLQWIGKRRDGSIWYGNRANAVYVNGGANTVIERNMVTDSEWAFAIATEPNNPPSHHVALRDNVAANDYAGIMLGNWYSDTDGTVVHDVAVQNNTVYGCASGFVVRPYTTGTVSWRNNLLAANRVHLANAIGWPVGDMDYDLYGPGAAPGPDAHKIVADPQFQDPTADPPDLSLRPGSPARNAGDPNLAPGPGETAIDGTPREVAPADLGAY